MNLSAVATRDVTINPDLKQHDLLIVKTPQHHVSVLALVKTLIMTVLSTVWWDKNVSLAVLETQSANDDSPDRTKQWQRKPKKRFKSQEYRAT